MMNFREHALIKRIVNSGFTEAQAEEFVDGMVEIISSYNNQLATKSDVYAVKQEVAEVKKDVYQLKSEIAELKSEVKQDISAVKSDISAVKSELRSVKWMFGFVFSTTLAILGVLAAHFINIYFT